jgi:hypothetical protein
VCTTQPDRTLELSNLLDVQVWLLKWDGQAVQIAAYGAGPRAALLGALPDRLILVRSALGGRAQMATRAVSLLPPLLQAWASLPASGLLPGTPIGARRHTCVL